MSPSKKVTFISMHLHMQLLNELWSYCAGIYIDVAQLKLIKLHHSLHQKMHLSHAFC